MNERLRHNSGPRYRSWALPGLINYETIMRSPFNYYEVSLLLHDEKGDHAVHLAHLSDPKEINIVIVDTTRNRKTGSYHVWSFGTFEGPSLGDYHTYEEQEEFIKKITNIIKYNRVAGSTLEHRLQEVITDSYQTVSGFIPFHETN